jgi:uncharacterized membrane protein
MKHLFAIILILSAPLLATEKPSRFYKSMELVFIGTQVADIASTYHALGRGGTEEGNPIARAIIGSKPATIAFKAIGSYAVLSLLRSMRKKNKTVAVLTLIVLNAGFGYVAYRNARIR